jgi:hypothetical protein
MPGADAPGIDCAWNPLIVQAASGALANLGV